MGSTNQVAHDCVILFDGVCNLCNQAVNTVIKFDTKSKFKFAPLQSEFAQTQLRLLSSIKCDSIVLIKKDKIFYKSDAAIEIAKDLSGVWPAVVMLKVFPRFVRDFVYDFIAKNRYRFFGRKDHCMIPTRQLMSRFIS